jgi:hypothetical protein
MTDWWAADRFGWDPEQVARAPAQRLKWLQAIDARIARVRHARARP